MPTQDNRSAPMSATLTDDVDPKMVAFMGDINRSVKAGIEGLIAFIDAEMGGRFGAAAKRRIRREGRLCFMEAMADDMEAGNDESAEAGPS